VLKKYVLKTDRFPNCHVLDTPDGEIGALEMGEVIGIGSDRLGLIL
jgi:hypothetical protein